MIGFYAPQSRSRTDGSDAATPFRKTANRVGHNAAALALLAVIVIAFAERAL